MHAKIQINDNYSRTMMEGILLHNNRVDMIKSFMFKAQLMSSQLPSQSPQSEEKATSQEKTFKNKNRIVKILEAAERIKATPLEESKQSSGDSLKYLETSSGFNSRVKKDNSINIDDFEIFARLGKGAFGEVYLVRYKENRKFYAMKVLDKKKFQSLSPSHSFAKPFSEPSI